MYRIQLAGNEYEQDSEIGLHYQLHRSIGVHQAEAMRLGQPFRVNTFVGGHPAMTLAAVMPLPEGHERAHVRRRPRRPSGSGWRSAPVACRSTPTPTSRSAAPSSRAKKGERGSATFMQPEGPFGDHLGYYSLQHPFPVMRIDNIYHRDDAVWAFTVVGRPPQEDTAFGELIHDLDRPGHSDGAPRRAGRKRRGRGGRAPAAARRSAANATCRSTASPAPKRS